ncbi:GH32 C-terminal domain-containing protein [Streptomyces afghaniensis]|uniref:GH32 C-terminal domain-containing protein n=1 Tax=Streptomyces afghaniensis TaxID=66865 RepID=UPI0027877133|nr:sucrose-6-phosphate hydrolase SacC (GH32 family) [Streptomyces afghaniensis]
MGSLASLGDKRPATASGVTVRSASTPLIGPSAKGKALDIEATFSLEDADRFGLKVRTGAGGEETVIGYDTTSQELYADRTRSGAGDFTSTGVEVFAEGGSAALNRMQAWQPKSIWP